MKKLSALTLTLLFALLCLHAGAEAGVPTAIHDAVLGIISQDWMPENVMPRILDKAEDETYYTVQLVDAQTREPVAVMRVDDLETHRILYYRLAGHEMPAWQRSNALFGFDLPRDEDIAWLEFDRQWNDWADDIVSSLYGADHGKPDLLHCADSQFCIYAVCDDPHGDLTAALICQAPSADQESPVVIAYADVRTNPSSGYDGYLTGAQADRIALDALRTKFGDDVADHLQTDGRIMLIYDYCLYTEDFCDTDKDPEEEENSYDPLWLLYYVDPRGNWDEASYVDGYEDAYGYSVFLDAAAGEILWICDEPEEYGYG
ncbi:MAG: hypothetical protein IKP40_00430 [Clostridia bacterium]|nr:hypothetical protein [Clostridia bacterium]